MSLNSFFLTVVKNQIRAFLRLLWFVRPLVLTVVVAGEMYYIHLKVEELFNCSLQKKKLKCAPVYAVHD